MSIATSKYGFAATSGYRTDGDAGLMHAGARYYDPQVGRFASRDTVLTEHPYLYCEHDPVNAVDPSGHEYSDWNPFSWNYNFTRDDIGQIGRGIEEWGRNEMLVGAGIGGGTILGPDPGPDPRPHINLGPRQSVPGFPPAKYPWPYGPPGTKVFQWAKPIGIIRAIGGGLMLGGAISVGIGKWWQWVADH